MQKILDKIFLLLFFFLLFFYNPNFVYAQNLNLNIDQGPCCYCSGPYGDQCVLIPSGINTCSQYATTIGLQAGDCNSVSCAMNYGCPGYTGFNTQPQELPKTPPIKINLQIPLPIPGFPQELPITGDTLGQYIAALYRFFVGALGIVAVVVMMIGGFQWIIAAGSSERISHAKSTIFNAIIGLVLAITSYLILYVLNPSLVNFGSLNINEISPGPLGTAGLVGYENQYNNIIFHGDSPAWLPETAEAIDKAAEILHTDYPNLKLEIEGGSRNPAMQWNIFYQRCGSNTSCDNPCPTACNPNPVCGKNCSHANAIDIKTSAYNSADSAKVYNALQQAGFCKYTAENNHFEKPQWTQSCTTSF